MLRRLLRDSLVYGASTVMARAISLLLVPIYTRVLDPVDYGTLDILSIFGTLITLTVAVEIAQAVARFLPDADSTETRARLVSTAAIFTLGTYTAFLALGLMLVEPLGRVILGADDSPATVAAALLSIWSIGVFQFVQTVLRFSLRSFSFNASGLIYSGVSLGLGVVLVVGFRTGVMGVFIGQAVGGACASIIAVWFGRSLYKPVFSGPALRSMLSFSVPLVPAGLGVFVTLYVDRIALSELASLAAVGIFGIAYRFSSVITVAMLGFQMALTPLIYERHADESTPRELARVFRIFVGLALMICLALSIWAPEIVRLATTRAYYEAASVVPLLAPAILLANMYVFMPGLAIARRTRTLGVIMIGGAFLNTALNLLLIPMFDVRGAALATLVSAAIIFIAYAYTSERVYPVPHRWVPISLAVGGYVILALIGTQLGEGTAIGLVAKATLVAAMAMVVLGVRLVTMSDLRSLMGRTSAG